jgi:hypothetical protein
MSEEGNETLREVYRAINFASQKYIYFLLAAFGAGILFALNQTNEAKLTFSQWPLAVGICFWAISFLLGCFHLERSNSVMRSNLQLVIVDMDIHPLSGVDENKKAFGRNFLKDEMDKGADKASQFAKWQFRALIAGAIFYIGWHVWEMYLRSLPT